MSVKERMQQQSGSMCVVILTVGLRAWNRQEMYMYYEQCLETLIFIGPCIIVILEEWKTKLMLLANLFHVLCTQHVSEINIAIIRSLRLCCLITTSVVLFSVRCVLEMWGGWVWVVSVLQAEACNTDNTQTQPHQISNTQWTENKTTDVVIKQHSRKLLLIVVLISETCWAHKKWNKTSSDIKLVFYSSTKVWRIWRTTLFGRSRHERKSNAETD